MENDELWNKVKSGEVLGFSVEGLFTQTIEENSKFEKEVLEILDSCLTKEEKIEALRNKTEHL